MSKNPSGVPLKDGILALERDAANLARIINKLRNTAHEISTLAYNLDPMLKQFCNFIHELKKGEK